MAARCSLPVAAVLLPLQCQMHRLVNKDVGLLLEKPTSLLWPIFISVLKKNLAPVQLRLWSHSFSFGVGEGLSGWAVSAK